MEKKEDTFKSVIVRPHMTEKAALAQAKSNVYVFEVLPKATKKSVSAAIQHAHKVTPERIHLLAIPTKSVWRRGKWGTTGGGKKAYVYLKKGDKIEI
jgi:large subunit ribosomal protein L23